MTTPSDLASLSAVKSWLSVTSSSDDALLGSLITAASRAIYAYLGRSSILPATYSEWYDGRGFYSLTLRRWPVISVASVVADGMNIPAALNSPLVTGCYQSPGFLLRPWDGQPPGRIGVVTLNRYRFRRGQNNIGVVYSSGYQVSGEAATVPVIPYQVTAQAPYGPWASDMGVVYASTGLPLTPVAASPGVGQYVVNASTGVYTFNSADSGASVKLSYGFIPQSLVQACVETVAERYRYRDRVGQRSKSIGGQETVSFDLGRPGSGMSDFALGLLAPYRQVTPLDY